MAGNESVRKLETFQVLPSKTCKGTVEFAINSDETRVYADINPTKKDGFEMYYDRTQQKLFLRDTDGNWTNVFSSKFFAERSSVSDINGIRGCGVFPFSHVIPYLESQTNNAFVAEFIGGYKVASMITSDGSPSFHNQLLPLTP